MRSIKHRVESCDQIELFGFHIVSLEEYERHLCDGELAQRAEEWLLSGLLETEGCDISFVGVRKYRNGARASVCYNALHQTDYNLPHIEWELLCQANPA